MICAYEKKDNRKNGIHFQRTRKISIAGSKNGIIARYLEEISTPNVSGHFGWSIEVKRALKKLKIPGNSIVIDTKPKSETGIKIIEVVKIHGYCYPPDPDNDLRDGITPICFEIRDVVTSKYEEDFKKEDFIIFSQPKRLIIAYLYLQGTIEKGRLVGGWRFPPLSYTNGAFLYPKARNYFNSRTGYRKK